MHQAEQTRMPAVAGRFYPDDPDKLRAYIDSLLDGGISETQTTQPRPQAMILPHAGYPFSGQAAAQGYALIRPYREQIRHVVLLGPAHFAELQGMAVPAVARFASPLGDVVINEQMRATACKHPEVSTDDEPHSREHSIEVHLPFLQQALGEFDFLPIAVGMTSPQSCGQLLENFCDEETLIVVSSDLSHFYTDEQARQLDQRTTEAIERLEYESIEQRQACGAMPVRGLLWLAREKGMSASTIALCNSGDVTGERSSVVGYGSYVFH